MLRRSAFRRPEYTPAPAAPLRRIERAVSYSGTTTPAPKPEPKRNPVLLEMARDRECLLCPSGQCQCTPGSVVACHSNLSIHGKAGARKADDCYSVWGGDVMHKWLDQGGATAAEKARVFMEAHLRQVLAWRHIAMDKSEPERFRKAAQWALDELNATPTGDIA
jgi:hypothetical protein